MAEYLKPFDYYVDTYNPYLTGPASPYTGMVSAPVNKPSMLDAAKNVATNYGEDVIIDSLKTELGWEGLGNLLGGSGGSAGQAAAAANASGAANAAGSMSGAGAPSAGYSNLLGGSGATAGLGAMAALYGAGLYNYGGRKVLDGEADTADYVNLALQSNPVTV